MPVKWAASDSGELLVTSFTGAVTERQILAEMEAFPHETLLGREYAALLVFSPSVDLSALDWRSLDAVYQYRLAQFQTLGLRRRAGAALVPSAVDAQIILPLWNALGPNLTFTTFERLVDAADYLNVDVEEARQLLTRV